MGEEYNKNMTEEIIPITYYVLFGVGIIATITDFLRRKIYNWLTLPAILVGLILNSVLGGWWGLFDSIAGLLLGGIIFLILGLMGMMGGGDVKLAAAVGALIGWYLTVSAIYYGALCGAVLALIWALLHGTLWPTLRRLWRAAVAFAVPGMRPEAELMESETEPMPYGVAISWGAIIAAFKVLPPVI